MHKAIKAVINQLKSSNKIPNQDYNNLFLLIDGNYFKPSSITNDTDITSINANDSFNKKFNKINNGQTLRYRTIEGGDNKYTAIAAASILAKVERDKYIDELCSENPDLIEKYGLDSNKGYGSKKHMDGIKQYGISKWHRRSFGICKDYAQSSQPRASLNVPERFSVYKIIYNIFAAFFIFDYCNKLTMSRMRSGLASNRRAYRCGYCIQLPKAISSNKDERNPFIVYLTDIATFDGSQWNLNNDIIINEFQKFTIPEGDTLIIPVGKQLINNGTINIYGTLVGLNIIINNGTINNYSNTITIESECIFTNNKTINNKSGAVISNNGGKLENNAVINNLKDSIFNNNSDGIININNKGVVNNTGIINNIGIVNSSEDAEIVNMGIIHNKNKLFNKGAIKNNKIITNYIESNFENYSGAIFENYFMFSVINVLNNSGTIINNNGAKIHNLNVKSTINNLEGGNITNKTGATIINMKGKIINNNGAVIYNKKGAIINNHSGTTFTNIGSIINEDDNPINISSNT